MTDNVAEATAAIARGERYPYHYVTIAWERAQAGDRIGAFGLFGGDT